MPKKKMFLVFTIAAVLLAVWQMPTRLSTRMLTHLDQALASHHTEFKDERYAIVIDYSKPVFKRRLWVIDLETRETLINAHVSHAKNSGSVYASSFSNEIGSEYSCKGVFKTLHSYESSFGKGDYKIGMRLKGLNAGINDHANKRNIVFHTGYSWWSKGCFMTWPKVNKEIIDLCKEGSIVVVD